MKQYGSKSKEQQAIDKRVENGRAVASYLIRDITLKCSLPKTFRIFAARPPSRVAVFLYDGAGWTLTRLADCATVLLRSRTPQRHP
jgi:hypothetical protein